eukprot:565359-Pyramimonas_sp.AAC.1
MLILPPSMRKFLERGPPASLRKALEEFDKRAVNSRAEAGTFVAELGCVLPAARARPRLARDLRGCPNGWLPRPSGPRGCPNWPQRPGPG